ncbi:MAG: hypothetical protein KBD60_01025 [Sterolibacterium sp.]|jgi:hypothetical protein|nr:hypothetical protein [Sterolibacterium sp.]
MKISPWWAVTLPDVTAYGSFVQHNAGNVPPPPPLPLGGLSAGHREPDPWKRATSAKFAVRWRKVAALQVAEQIERRSTGNSGIAILENSCRIWAARTLCHAPYGTTAKFTAIQRLI